MSVLRETGGELGQRIATANELKTKKTYNNNSKMLSYRKRREENAKIVRENKEERGSQQVSG